jgi:hypothetical protein
MNESRRGEIAVVSDFGRAFSAEADERNVEIIRRRHQWWGKLARRMGWRLKVVDLARVDESQMREAKVVWIDMPLLTSDRYRWAWGRCAGAAQGAEVLDRVEDVSAVYGLDRSLGEVAKAGFRIPRTALVPVDERTAGQIESPRDVRRLLSEKIYRAVFDEGIDPHEGLYIRGYYSSLKSPNAVTYYASNQEDLEETACEVIKNLRRTLEVGGLAVREFLELEKLHLPWPQGGEGFARLPWEVRFTILERRTILASYHGPFDGLSDEEKRRIEDAVGKKEANLREVEELGQKLATLAVGPNYCADVGFLKSGEPVVIELNPLYSSGYNVARAHAWALVNLGAGLAERAGYARAGRSEIVEAAEELCGEKIEDGPLARFWG